MLSDVGSLPAGLEDSLRRYVSGGGSLLIALGPGSAALPKVPVIDESIEASRYAGREGERFLAVSEIDTGHPALRSVEKFAGVKIYQAIHVTPARSRVLARLNDQTPLVLERQIGEGKVLVFASTFDNVANDLPLHAAWVPFVVQSAAYLGGGGAEQPVNMAVDSYVELRAADNKGAAAEVLLRRRSRGIFRTEDRQRPAEPDRSARRPARIGPDRHSQRNAGSLESHRTE